MVPVSGRVRLLANRVKLVGLYKHVNLPLAQLPVVTINPARLPMLYAQESNENVRNIDYSFVNMSTKKHLFTVLIYTQQHFHHKLHPNHHS